LIGGPRAYYLSLFNDDTVLFNEEAAAAVGEAERIHLEQKRLLATLEGGAGEQKEPHVAAASSSSSASKRKTAGAGALSNAGGAHTPMLLQDDVLVEPSYLHHGNTVSLRKLLAEGPGYQAGDLSVLARVFAKSRVFNFGRKTVGVRPDLLRAPFSFELLVGDASGEQIKGQRRSRTLMPCRERGGTAPTQRAHDFTHVLSVCPFSGRMEHACMCVLESRARGSSGRVARFPPEGRP
jgi:hypothetical protein